MNVWALYATENSEGPYALMQAINSEARAAGASSISITGNGVMNEGLLSISPRAAGRFGLEFRRINDVTILLQGGVRGK